jgi:hypothetical protein
VVEDGVTARAADEEDEGEVEAARKSKGVKGPGAVTSEEWTPVAKSFTERPKVSNSTEQELSAVN